MFQLHVSIYVSIISISTKEIILFHNYKFSSRVGFTKGFTSVLRRIIISLVSWQLSIYTSLNSHCIEKSDIESKAKTKTHTLHVSINVSIISMDTKEIILFHNYKFISRIGFTSVLLEVLLVF